MILGQKDRRQVDVKWTSSAAEISWSGAPRNWVQSSRVDGVSGNGAFRVGGVVLAGASCELSLSSLGAKAKLIFVIASCELVAPRRSPSSAVACGEEPYGKNENQDWCSYSRRQYVAFATASRERDAVFSNEEE
ncbi:hypothetical protein E5D57_008513 [Metarhizium anisopliae]|nr:hypothetical protein E5D57_008513 [Metarhizium anisopliae]